MSFSDLLYDQKKNADKLLNTPATPTTSTQPSTFSIAFQYRQFVRRRCRSAQPNVPHKISPPTPSLHSASGKEEQTLRTRLPNVKTLLGSLDSAATKRKQKTFQLPIFFSLFSHE